jgi:hypothetical protein
MDGCLWTGGGKFKGEGVVEGHGASLKQGSVVLVGLQRVSEMDTGEGLGELGGNGTECKETAS